MKFKFKNMAAVGVLALGFVSAHAAVIGYGDYSRDDTSNVISNSHSNLQWLTWSETQGQSIISAVANYSASGYRLASNTEMAGLFTDFFSSGAWSTNENTISNLTGVYDHSDGASKGFMSLFGKTVVDEGCVGGIHPVSDCSADFLNSTGALFGSDSDNDNRYNLAKVTDEFIFSPSAGLPQLHGERATFSLDGNSAQYSDALYGVALVREAPQAPVSNVPEPASLSLLCLGLAGLGFARRQKTS